MADKFAETDAREATTQPSTVLHQHYKADSIEQKPATKDSTVTAMGFPNTSVGNFIERDVPFAKPTIAPFTDLLDIAREHIGEGASDGQIKAHAEEILAVNPGRFDSGKLLEGIQTNDREEIVLPGHKADGSIIYLDSAGNKRTYTPDHAVTLERKDGTGYKRTAEVIDGQSILLERHFGPHSRDNFEITFSSDGKFLRTSKSEIPTSSLNYERHNLSQQADQSLLMQKENKAFKADMQAFELRAKSQGLPQEEIARTYRDLSAILALKGQEPLTSRERVRLATGTLRNAASPRSISQGEYGTCQTAVIEERIYAKEPSVATAIMLQIASRGEFDTKCGTRVKMEPINMRAHGEAALNPPPGAWLRSYASQVFQTATINTILTKDNETLLPPRDIRYVQNEHNKVVLPPRSTRLGLTELVGSEPTGEMLMDYSKNPPVKIANQTSTGNIDQMRGLYQQLTGKDRPDLFLVPKEMADAYKTFGSGSTFNNKEELGAYLTKLRQSESGDIYAAIAVHVNSDTLLPTLRHMPLAGEANLVKLEYDHHVLSVVDYDARTQMVKVDGSWGNDRDFIEKPMTLDQLYNATQIVTGERWMQRLEGIKSKVKAEDFDMQLAMVMFTMSNRWALNSRRGLPLQEEDVRKTVNYYKQLRQGRQLKELSITDQIVEGLEAPVKN